MNYNVGDKIRIKDIDWYNENKDANGDVLCFYGVHKFTKEMSKFCNKTVTISTDLTGLTGDGEYLIKDDDETNWWTDDMIECKVEDENTDCEKCGLTRNSTRCLFMDNCPHNKQKNIIEIPEDYVLKDENGNIINATKIVLEKKKKEYPKTYEECRDLIEGSHVGPFCADLVATGYLSKLMERFARLIICRDAYWKIAGEEMGLGKPWEPDYDSGVNKFGIICLNGVVQESNPTTNWERHLNKVLDFPTAEMRDAFKKNFDSEIEICKEFL